jgi:hypothetical protein
MTMTTATKPANLLEYYKNEANAKRTAAKIAEEAKQATGHGQWSTSMNCWISPDIAARHPELIRKDSKDFAGRVISEFEGEHPRAWMQEWMQQPRRLTAINTK